MVITEDPLKTNVFFERVEFLKKSQWWSKEEFEKYQWIEFKNLLVYCDKNILYYQKLFKKNKIKIAEINSLSNIKKIPFLTKKDIQGHYEEFIPFSVNIKDLKDRSTGGSTGTPLAVYADIEFLSKDKANTVYYMDIAGYNFFDYKSLRIYGDKIPEEYIKNGEFWYRRENKLIMSCYHYSIDTFPKYIEKINNYKPSYIHSRPSALIPLVEYVLNKEVKFEFNFGAVFLDGELLSDSQRDRIEKAFRCRVYNIYGHTEGCAVGISCRESRLLHFMPQVGILELLDEKGEDIKEEDKKGEIVVTGFNNKVFPLIRYRTFDIAAHTNKRCTCGRNYKMLKRLEGRVQDFVVDFSKNLIPLSPAIFNYNDMDWKGVKQFQVHQDKLGYLTFKIVRDKNVKESKEEMSKRILVAFNKIFNNIFKLSVEYVNDIPRTMIGKFRYLDQKLDMALFELPR